MEQLLLPVMLLGALGLMMWFSSRTRKQQAQAMSFLDDPQGGERVMTRSGMYGTLVEVDGDTVTLEIAPGVETQWVRAAIAKLVEEPPAVEDDEYEDDEYDEDEYEDDDARKTTGDDAVAEPVADRDGQHDDVQDGDGPAKPAGGAQDDPRA